MIEVSRKGRSHPQGMASSAVGGINQPLVFNNLLRCSFTLVIDESNKIQSAGKP